MYTLKHFSVSMLYPMTPPLNDAQVKHFLCIPILNDWHSCKSTNILITHIYAYMYTACMHLDASQHMRDVCACVHSPRKYSSFEF
jgi:hypothetical protein